MFYLLLLPGTCTKDGECKCYRAFSGNVCENRRANLIDPKDVYPIAIGVGGLTLLTILIIQISTSRGGSSGKSTDEEADKQMDTLLVVCQCKEYPQ